MNIKLLINYLLAEKAHEYNFKRNSQQLCDTMPLYVGNHGGFMLWMYFVTINWYRMYSIK